MLCLSVVVSRYQTIKIVVVWLGLGLTAHRSCRGRVRVECTSYIHKHHTYHHIVPTYAIYQKQYCLYLI